MKLFPLIATLIISLSVAMTTNAAKQKAKAKIKKPSATEVMQQAHTAFDAYEFDKAIELIDGLGDDGELTADMEQLRHKAEIGSTMLSRVEHIAIIDSITVDRRDFFLNYMLSSPAGYVSSTEELPEGFATDDSTTVYVTESAETMIWSRPTSDGGRQLVESHLLADGTWEQPQSLGEALEGISANYPFLQPDGTTLYFAARGNESLGGYDIFISRNDGDEFLQPQNIGMPYNSPYDDYLLAIDELTGAGWWATDRNRLDGKITIYVFVPQDLRINYAVNDPELTNRAFITSIKSTLDPKRDYSPILKAIEALDSEVAGESSDFIISIPGRGVLTRYDQLRSADSRHTMDLRQDCMDEIADMELSLEELRRQYATDKSVATAIKNAENKLESLRANLRTLTNRIVTLETSR